MKAVKAKGIVHVFVSVWDECSRRKPEQAGQAAA